MLENTEICRQNEHVTSIYPPKKRNNKKFGYNSIINIPQFSFYYTKFNIKLSSSSFFILYSLQGNGGCWTCLNSVECVLFSSFHILCESDETKKIDRWVHELLFIYTQSNIRFFICLTTVTDVEWIPRKVKFMKRLNSIKLPIYSCENPIKIWATYWN